MGFVATTYLQFRDDIIVEIGSPSDGKREMHAANAEQVDTTMEMVGQMLSRILAPIGDAFKHLHDVLDVPIAVEGAEVEIGLAFSAEGNIFVAKSKAEGTLGVKVTFKPIGQKA
jgi:hypothetical protein